MYIFHKIVVCSILLSKKGYNIVAFQYLKHVYMKDRERLFTLVCSDKTTGIGFKLKEDRSQWDIRKTLLVMRGMWLEQVA